jgi:hypothetical protein
MPINQIRQRCVPHLPPVISVGLAATPARACDFDVGDTEVALSLNGTSLSHFARHVQNNGGVILETAASDVAAHDDGSKRIIDGGPSRPSLDA